MFLLSYYSGISFVDMMLPKKIAMTGSHVDFIRQKTVVHVRFEINRVVEENFAEYKALPDSIYLLDVIKNNCEDQKYIRHKKHNELSRKVNPRLNR